MKNEKDMNSKETKGKTKSRTREYVESLIIAAIIAFFVRSFFIQAFRIPSSSMEPTLLIGDHLLVNRLSYVMKIPFTDNVIFNLGDPKKGDVIVFRYPVDPDKDFIKRVIATEGDTVAISNKVIYINGQKTEDKWGHYSDSIILPEFVNPRDNFGPFTVPKNSYFVMGDNRDRSLDSRYWGVVSREHLVGRALILYFSLNSKPDNMLGYVRWSRIGSLIR